jgi:hypothetical protein
MVRVNAATGAAIQGHGTMLSATSDTSETRRIDAHSRLIQSPDALAQELDGETVIMDLASESYFGLNEAGTEIWNLLDGTRTTTDIAMQLTGIYDAPEEILMQDCLALLAKLLEAGLVELLADGDDA